MRLAGRVFAGLTLAGAATLLLSSAAGAQARVGVVTNLEGTVMVARLTEPVAQPLTARERSVLTITEVPGVATVELGEPAASADTDLEIWLRGADTATEIRPGSSGGTGGQAGVILGVTTASGSTGLSVVISGGGSSSGSSGRSGSNSGRY